MTATNICYNFVGFRCSQATLERPHSMWYARNKSILERIALSEFSTKSMNVWNRIVVGDGLLIEGAIFRTSCSWFLGHNAQRGRPTSEGGRMIPTLSISSHQFFFFCKCKSVRCTLWACTWRMEGLWLWCDARFHELLSQQIWSPWKSDSLPNY